MSELEAVRDRLARSPGELTPHRVAEALRATGRPVGDCPRRPTAYCWFWAATACWTSLAVTPSCAMRSGLSQIRIA